MPIKTFSALEYMNATNYNTYCQNNGLKWLDTQTTTTATFLRSNVFTTEFDSYRIIVDSYKPNNATDSLFLRMRTSGGVYSGNTYYSAVTGVNFATATVNNGGGLLNAFYVTNGANTRSSGATIEINNLRPNTKPTFYWQNINADNGNNNLGGGFINNVADYVGVELLGSGTMTCNMSIYGYRKA
jgi:hypothetical protein